MEFRLLEKFYLPNPTGRKDLNYFVYTNSLDYEHEYFPSVRFYCFISDNNLIKNERKAFIKGYAFSFIDESVYIPNNTKDYSLTFVKCPLKLSHKLTEEEVNSESFNIVIRSSDQVKVKIFKKENLLDEKYIKNGYITVKWENS